MQKIPCGLLKELETKLGVSKRQVYRRIEEKVSDTHLDRHLAAIVLAGENGINISKFSTPEDLAVIRGSKNQPIISITQSMPKMKSSAKEPGDSIDLDLGFVTDSGLKKILMRDLSELKGAVSLGYSNTAKTCMVLAGSIAEALLLDALKQKEASAKLAASKLPQKPSSNLDDWSLFDMVNVAILMIPSLLPCDAVSGANQLRKWRNLIHPGRELKESKSNRISPTPARAKSAVSFLQFIAEELN